MSEHLYLHSLLFFTKFERTLQLTSTRCVLVVYSIFGLDDIFRHSSVVVIESPCSRTVSNPPVYFPIIIGEDKELHP